VLNNYAHIFDLLIRLRQVSPKSCFLHSVTCDVLEYKAFNTQSQALRSA